MRKSVLAAAMAMIGLMSSSAQAAAKACLTRPEAASLMTAVLPDLLDGISKKCAASLPENATLRGGLAPLMDRDRAAAEVAWPQASLAFAKIAGDQFKGVDPKLIRPMIGPILADMVSKDIKPAQCPMIDRIVGGLAPLPSQNLADVFVAVLELNNAEGKKSELPICPLPAGSTAAL